MVTVTVYSDSIQVVVDVGVATRTAPWLAETTFLLDSLGHTTALIAQTGPVMTPIKPVPWTPTPVAAAAATVTSSVTSVSTSTQNPTTAAATLTTSSTSSTPSPTQSSVSSFKGTSPLLIGLLTSGIVVVIMIITVGIYLCRRERKRREASPEGYGSSKSSNSSSSSSAMSRPWDLRPATDTTWSEFLEEFEDEVKHFDDSKVSSRGDYSSRIGEGRSSQGGYRETVEERQERLWRLANRNHSPPPPNVFIRGRDRPNVSFKPASETIESSPPSLSGPTIKFPLSILKRPPTPTPSMIGARPANRPLFGMLPTAFQTTSGGGPTYRPNFAEKSPDATKPKKGVRFGVDQIKEFGRTPAASLASSIRSQSIR